MTSPSTPPPQAVEEEQAEQAESAPSRWFVDAIALVLALGMAYVALFVRDHIVVSERVNRLQLETQRMATLVESVSSNGVVISGASLIGVIDARAKRLLANQTSAVGWDVLADLNTVLHLLQAKAVSIFNDQGVVVTSLDMQGTIKGINADRSQKPYVRSALTGKAAVYPDIDDTSGERRLHLAVPVYQEVSVNAHIAGVYHLETDMSAIESVLAGYSPRAAMLVSPEGLIFASNRSSLQLKLLYPLTPQAQTALQQSDQFGHLAAATLTNPIATSAKASSIRFEGDNFNAASSNINWTTPQGEWRAVLMEADNGAIEQIIRIGLALTVFGVLFGGYIMLSRHNRDQAKALHTIADQLDFQERLIDAIPTPIFVKDAQGRSVGLNRAYEDAYGVKREDLAGKTLREIAMDNFDAVQLENYYQEQLQLIASGERVHKARERPWKDGLMHHELYWGQGIRRADGEAAGMVGVILDISNTVHANIELQAAKVIAEEAGAAKSAFLANMSHEIRTPMNAIIGLAHLALRTDLNAQQRDYIKKVHDAGRSLLGIINDILDFSKIEAGKLEVESIAFDLDDVLTQVSTVTSAKAWEKDLELLIDVPQTVPRHLMGDPLRLGQVLINLINNAVKFTEKGQILVACRLISTNLPGSTATHLRFEVRDSGIGMTAEQCGKLFTPFSQADGSTTRKFGGTGLGLSISKHLVEMMGGEIGLSSEPGVGSVFYFTWVCQAAEAPARRPRVLPNALNHLRVLVVDDNADARNILSEAVRPFVSEVQSVDSGEAALDAMRSGLPYGLVLTDWKMPGMDGIDLTRSIKSDAQRHPMPLVVLVTAFGREEVKQQASQAQVDGLLFKPLNASTVVDTLVGLFDHRDTNERREGSDRRDSLDRRDGPEHSAQDQGEAIPHLHGLRVLLAEDNEINQQIALELMQSAGVTVEVADNGRIAVDKLNAVGPTGERAYHLVLMDLQMPVMDGHQATRAIRSDDRFAALPIIAMTAHAMVEERERCLANGMNDHITKPIDPVLLYQTLLRWGGHAVLPQVVANKNTGTENPNRDSAPVKVGPPDMDSSERLQTALPQLDIAGALRRVGGNQKLLIRLLHRYLEVQCHTPERIRAALAADDAHAAEIEAHTLKGVSANLGAKAVEDQAALLEQALRDPQGQVEALINHTAQALAPLHQALLAWFEADNPSTIPTTAAPVDTSSPAFQHSLNNLLALLNDMDGGAADALVDFEAQLGAAMPPPQLAALREHIAQFEFDEAAALLQGFERV